MGAESLLSMREYVYITGVAFLVSPPPVVLALTDIVTVLVVSTSKPVQAAGISILLFGVVVRFIALALGVTV